MIRYFNPGHETAVLNASLYYMAPANVSTMQYDLHYLPAWYSNHDDSVLIDKNQDTEYINLLRNIFPKLPGVITAESITGVYDNEISLWGISPQAIHVFSEIEKLYKPLIIPEWKNEYIYLTSRKAAKDCLEELTNKLSEISDKLIPYICTCIDEVEYLANTSKKQLLAKAPYSSSGRGLLWLSGTTLKNKEKEILHGIIKKQKYISIEPVLKKDTDFAMQFMCDGNGNVGFEGYSLFYTDGKGAYQGNYILSQEEINALLITRVPSCFLEQVKYELINILKTKYAPIYKGCVGVDMMIYEENGEYKLHPCIEINMRYNMGYLTLKLQQNYISPSSKGKFKIDYNAKEKGIYTKHIEMMNQYPLSLIEGRVQSGYLSLCPVAKKSKYHAYILIQEKTEAIEL